MRQITTRPTLDAGSVYTVECADCGDALITNGATADRWMAGHAAHHRDVIFSIDGPHPVVGDTAVAS